MNKKGQMTMKMALDIWFDLVLKVKYSTILIFKVIFLCQKSAEFVLLFFIEEFQIRIITFISDTF